MLKLSKKRPQNGNPLAKWQALCQKYTKQGEDAFAKDDLVEAERNFQYAEHYVHLIGTIKPRVFAPQKQECIEMPFLVEAEPSALQDLESSENQDDCVQKAEHVEVEKKIEPVIKKRGRKPKKVEIQESQETEISN